MKMQQQYNRICGILLLMVIVVGTIGCAAKHNMVTQDKPKITELKPGETRFHSKVTDRATFFNQRSQSIYGAKKENVPWWRKLWPWGQKTTTNEPAVNMKEWHFSAKYQNTTNKKK